MRQYGEMMDLTSPGDMLVAAVSTKDMDMLEASLREASLSDSDTKAGINLACDMGSVEVLEKILQAGHKAARPAMWAACMNGHLDVVKALTRHGLRFDETARGICKRHGHEDVFEALP